MINHLRSFGLAIFACALAGPLAAQTTPPVPPAPIPGQSAPPAAATDQPPSNPVCVRLEGQLAMINRGSVDSARSDQIKRTEDSIAKQQADLDRTLAQSKRAGCEGGGFFALFTGQSPQCQPLSAQIQQKRDDLDRAMSELERLKSGNNSDLDGQRRQLIGQLAQNNCGEQYTAAANSQGGPRGFFDALFGGGTILNPNGDGAPSGTYHTVCVRSCDGYYFPISYSTLPTHFTEDQLTCQRECPATEVALYSFRNPGEGMDQAVSTTGQPYTALPNAYRYRTTLVAGCSCRRPGQSWADALKNADDSSTLENGDIVVTDKTAKVLSQPPKPPGKAAAAANPAQPAPPAAASLAATTTTNAAGGEDKKQAVRVVGPPFLSTSQMSSQSAQPVQPPSR